MNPCFELLDRAIVEGRADDLFLSDPAVTYALMLEEVAAVAGVLRAVGVETGSAVVVDSADDRVAVVALLAVLRLGAVMAAGAAVAVTDVDGAAHLRWGDDARELDWPGVLKAGRTDPAPALDGAVATELRLVTPASASEVRSTLRAALA